MDQLVNVFGATGFIGSRYSALFPSLIQGREDNKPKTNDILYFISTTDNYNVFDNLYLDVNTNLIKLLKVLEEIRKDPVDITFNFISSWFVYGDNKLPVNEEAYCNPKGFYSITKRCAEQLLISFCQTYKINYRILRLCSVYGECDKGVSAKKNAFQFLVNKLKENSPIGLYWGGDFLRDFMYVDDVCRAINLIITEGNKNEIYNVGSGVGTSFKELIMLAKSKLQSTSNITTVAPSEFHKIVQVKDMVLDSTKLFGLGFKPLVTIEEGVQKLI